MHVHVYIYIYIHKYISEYHNTTLYIHTSLYLCDVYDNENDTEMIMSLELMDEDVLKH